jgi:ABC-2 type transport system permease protein
MIMRTIGLVMRRELRAARKPFLISTGILLVVAAVGLTIMTIVEKNDSDDGSITYGLGMVGAVPAGLPGEVRLRLPEGHNLATARFGSVDAAEEALREGDVGVVVVGDDTVLWGPWVSVTMAESLVDSLQALKARDQAADLGLTSAEMESLLDPQLEFRSVARSDDGSEADEAASAIAVIVMFTAILAYGQWIGYSVADEKGSRVVELILGAVPPHHLLTGKLLAVGSMGLTQMTLLGSLVVGYGLAADLVNMPDLALGLVLWMLVWFLLGYAFYGAIYAAGGSLVADTHEASSTLGVLNILPIVGYLFGVIAFSQGTDTGLLRTFSLIPLWAPMTMPGRIARGWAAPWEVGLSVALMLLAIYGVIRMAGWVYRGGVARASSKLGWREAFRTGRDLGAGRTR